MALRKNRMECEGGKLLPFAGDCNTVLSSPFLITLVVNVPVV